MCSGRALSLMRDPCAHGSERRRQSTIVRENIQCYPILLIGDCISLKKTPDNKKIKVAAFHHRSGSILVCGWTMMNKFGHPVATLPSDGGDYTSLSQKYVNSANQRTVYCIIVIAIELG
eukprot:6212969-Pleurochrysis_carterae.AAC.4